MDTRIKLREIRTFFKNVRTDYRTPSPITQAQKKAAYWRLTKLAFMNLWNVISAPFIYPLWYLFRKKITEKVYRGTSWQYINAQINENKTKLVREMLQANGKFWYWMWTYGDLRDPLGMGEIVDYGIPNTFWNRYKENAFRNARYTTNFMDFRTGDIMFVVTVIDNRNFTYMHKSEGIGDSPDGVYFKWVKDDRGWGFIYEDNNSQNIFYFGFVGLLKKDIGGNGRFEFAYRKTDSSYRKYTT